MGAGVVVHGEMSGLRTSEALSFIFKRPKTFKLCCSQACALLGLMLDAIYLLFIIPESPLGCSPTALVEQKLLQVYSVWSGETNTWLYFIQAVFPFLASCVSPRSALVRDCCRLPIFESLLGCCFCKQEGREYSNQKSFCNGIKGDNHLNPV